MSPECARSISNLSQLLLYSAGTDTTSVLVSYALLRLSENPERCERLRKEVTEAAEDSMCADISTLAKLPYVGVLRVFMELY